MTIEPITNLPEYQGTTSDMFNKGLLVPELPAPEASLIESLGAVGVRDYSQLVNGNADLAFLKFTEEATDKGVDFYKEAINSGIAPQDAEKFFYVNDSDTFNRLKKQISTEVELSNILANSGGNGAIAELAYGVVDPTIVIPTVGVYKALKNASNLTKFGVSTAAGLTTNESLKQIGSETRDVSDSLINIGAGTLLAMTLARSPLVSNPEVSTRINRLEKNINDLEASTAQRKFIDDDPLADLDTIYSPNDSASAARTPGSGNYGDMMNDSTVFRPEGLAGKVFDVASAVTKKTSALYRLSASDYLGARQLAEGLGDVNQLLKKNLGDFGATDPGVGARVRAEEGNFVKAHHPISDSYKAYRKEFDMLPENSLQSPTGRPAPLSYEDFKIKAANFYEKTGKMAAYEAQNLEEQYFLKLNKTTKEWIDNVESKAREVGLLNETNELPGNTPYLTHIYNSKKVAANIPKVKEVLTRGYKKQLAQEFKSLSKKLRAHQEGTKVLPEAELKEVTDTLEYYKVSTNRDTIVRDRTDSTIDSLLNLDHNVELPTYSMSERGVYKTRSINFPVEDLAFVMDRDLEHILEKTYRTAVPEIELTRKFGSGRFGDTDLYKNMKEEFKVKLNAETDETVKAKMYEEFTNTLRTSEDLWEQIRGTYKSTKGGSEDKWRRASAALRNLTYLTNMGGVLLSSLGDPIIVSTINGYAPLIKNMKNILQSESFRKLNKLDAQSFGKGLNTVNGSRMTTTYDISDPFVHGSAMERFLSNSARKMGNFTGINQWTDFWEEVATATYREKVIGAVDQFINGTIEEVDRVWLQKLGVDDFTAESIQNQVRRFGIKANDEAGELVITDLGLDNWTNKKLAAEMKAILNKAVSSKVVVKTHGDTPIFTGGELGKVITQFMSFGLASMTKIVLPGLQGADGNFLKTFGHTLIAGVGIYAIKQKLNGRDTVTDPVGLIVGAFDQSPYLAIPMMINRQLEPVGVGLSQLSADPNQYNPVNATSNGLGVNFSTVKRLSGVAGAVGNLATFNAPTASQVDSIIKSTPWNNVLYIKPFVHDNQYLPDVESGLNTLFGNEISKK